MYYAQMRRFDTSNGPGIRATLFVSGCKKRCPGCHNPEAQNFKYGKEWTPLSESLFISYCLDEHVKGITILGGEPFDQLDDDLLNLLRRIKSLTQKPIWIYSGYLFEELIKKNKAMLEQCDILVDGAYIESLKDLKLKYRGSSNQRLINIQYSLASDKIIEIDSK